MGKLIESVKKGQNFGQTTPQSPLKTSGKYSTLEYDRTEATDDKGGYKHPREVNTPTYRHGATQLEHMDDKLGILEHSERMTDGVEMLAEHEIHEFGDFDGHGGFFKYDAADLARGFQPLGEFDGTFENYGEIKGGDEVSGSAHGRTKAAPSRGRKANGFDEDE